jgi:two-component system sensor kinase FixL
MTDNRLHTSMSPRPGMPTGLPEQWRAFAIGAAFVLIYVALAWLTRFYMVRPFSITPWNPSAGFALAFLLVCGIRYWPALAVAALTSALLLRGLPEPPYTQLLGPLSLTAGYVAMAAVLSGPLRFRIAFDRLGEIVKLAATAAIGTLLIALAYSAVLNLRESLTTPDSQAVFLRFWIGHLIGVVINTPLLLLLWNQRLTPAIRVNRRFAFEIGAQAGCVILALWIIFGPRWIDPYKFFYLLFLPVIWIATRHGVSGAILGIAGVQIGLIAALVNSEFQIGTGITEFQFMMLALAIAGLFLGMVVTEGRSARESLARSDSRLRAIVGTAPDGIVTIDGRGVILAANPAACRIFELAQHRFDGAAITAILPAFNAIGAAGDAGVIEGLRSDGRHFPAEVSIGHTGGAADLRIAVIRDISRRVETAHRLAEQQEELARASRLAAAGEMAAALAHELHQPLTAIRSYARAAQLQSDAAGRALPAKIETEAARAATVVQRLRDFFRGGTSRLETVAIDSLLENALAPMHEVATRQNIVLAIENHCVQGELLIDRIQVETVIHSLVHNAIEAMSGSGGGGRITVSAMAQNEGWVRMSVADTGPGIDAAFANRVFEAFATTKSTGTGMGLAMSRSMIEAQGGRIWFELPPGGGAAFHFTLPTTLQHEAVA